MQTLWLPGHELQLVEELQRQQNHSQFCDTVLQTEGICVPAHSCVLAAFSPYLSWQLSASPSHPSNQQRRLQLHPLKAQTLLKLVHLLYCGHMEVNAGVERTDVLAAARHFGIRELIEGHKHGGMKTGGLQGRSRRSRKDTSQRDAQVQTELSSGWSSSRRCVSTGVQTVDAVEGLGHRPVVSDHRQRLSTAPSLAQSGDFSVPVTADACVSFNSGLSIGSDGASRSEPSSDTETSTTLTSLLFRDTLALQLSPNNVSSLSVHQLSSEDNGRAVLANGNTRVEDGTMDNQTAENRQRRKQPGNADGHGAIGRQKRGVKNLTMMQQMQEVMDTTQISIKVKLRRTTKQFWEVVSLRDTDEMLSVITSLRQDGSNIINPQREVKNIQPPTSSSLTEKPGTCALQPVASATLKAFPPADTTPSDRQPVGGASFSLNHNSSLVSASLQPPGDGTDELIEKLLEDIMMGRNVLPSMDSNKADPHHLSYDGASSDICQVPVGEAKHDVVNAAKCVCYQDYEIQRSHSTADEAVLCGIGAQSCPGCTGLPSADLDQPGPVQLSSPLRQSSSRSTGRRKGCQSLPLPNLQTPAARSTVASASSSNEQKLHFLTCKEFISPDDLPGVEFYPLLDGHKAQNLKPLSISDFHLPQCLSPLDPVFNNTANCDNKIQAQPGSLQGRPWLMGNPGSVQFPLSAITWTDCMCPPPQQNINGRHQKKQMELNSRNWGTPTDLYIENVVKVRKSASGQNAIRRRVGERLESHKYGTAVDDVSPTVKKKKRCKCFPQDHASSVMVYKDVNTMDGTQSQINLAVCSVSMSSNNVLAKEREQVVRSLKTPPTRVGKPNQQLTLPASEEVGGLLGVTDNTQIKTWGGLKRAEETPIKATPRNSAQTGILKERDVSRPKRKRGRPQKRGMKNISHLHTGTSNIGEKSHREESGHQSEKREGTQPEKQERGGRKSTPSRSTEEEADGRKLTEHSEHPGISEEDDNNNVKAVEEGSRTPKQPRMFSLKDFQELVKRQHLKIHRSKENQKEINECVGKAEDEGGSHSSTDEESTQETETNKGCQPHISGDTHEQYKRSEDNSTSPLDNTGRSSTDRTGSVSGQNQDHGGGFLAVLEQEVDSLAADTQHPLKTLNQEVTVIVRLSDETEMIVNDSDSAHGPKEDQMAPDVGPNPQQTPERAKMCRRDISRRPVSDEEVKEVDEVVEVDEELKEVEVDTEVDEEVDVEDEVEVDTEVDEEVNAEDEVEVDTEVDEEVKEVNKEMDEEVEVDKEMDVELDEEVDVEDEVEVDVEVDEEVKEVDVEVDEEVDVEDEVEVDTEVDEEVKEVDKEMDEEVEVDKEMDVEVDEEVDVEDEVEVDTEVDEEVKEVDKEMNVEVDKEMNVEVEVDKEMDVEVEVDTEVDEKVDAEDEVEMDKEVKEVDKEMDVEVEDDTEVKEVDVEVDTEVEVDEEEEVDILILSPDKRPPDTEGEVNSVEISPDEDNEDVDVTGDETE